MSDVLYNAKGTIIKDELWQQHIPLVRHEALKLASRLPSSVELDDLLQVGYIGLLNAAERYDPKHGTAFTTYATQRIRGAMLDELRSRDWIPRQVRQDIKRINAKIQELGQKLGREPEEAEVANQLQMPLDEYQKILLYSNVSQLFSYDEMKEVLGDAVDSLIIQSNDNNPLMSLLDDETRDIIAKEIEALPEKEKLVLVLYYQEELNLREIGAVLEISESRVSQLHSQAIKQIKSRIIKQKQQN